MDIKIKNKKLNFKNILGFLGILIFSFLFYNFVLAYPVKDRSDAYIDILSSSPDLNNIINLDVRALIQDSLQKTIKEIPSLNDIFQWPTLLPLGNNLSLSESPGSLGSFKDIINFKDFNTDNAYGGVKSVIILILRLFVVALVSVAEVLKVFIGLLTASFK